MFDTVYFYISPIMPKGLITGCSLYQNKNSS